VHKLDAPALADPSLNLSGVVGAQLTLPDADVLLEEGDCVEEAGIRFDVLHTPGHTPGSVCYRHEKTLFCGDTLFYQGYGRVDLAGGNSLQMALSLKRLLKNCRAIPSVTRPRHENEDRQNRRQSEDRCPNIAACVSKRYRRRRAPVLRRGSARREHRPTRVSRISMRKQTGAKPSF
ncbi:MAG: MBL fold metallo-hydrolase, partial [Christensenellales bacterium]